MYFIHDVGVPIDLVIDGVKEDNKGESEDTKKKFNIRQRESELYFQ